jgi:hypothetical protein
VAAYERQKSPVAGAGETAEPFCYHCGGAVEAGQAACPNCGMALDWSE